MILVGGPAAGQIVALRPGITDIEISRREFEPPNRSWFAVKQPDPVALTIKRDRYSVRGVHLGSGDWMRFHAWALVHESITEETQIQAAVLAGCFTMSFLSVSKRVPSE